MTRRATILAICVMAGVGALAPALAQPVELANEHMILRFDPDHGYALSGLVNRAHDTDFIEPRAEGAAQERSAWAVQVRGRTVSHTLTGADARGSRHAIEGDTLRITWEGVASQEAPGDLTVTATVRLPEGSRRAFWGIEVSGRTTGWVWQVDFPRVFGLRDFADCQMALPYYWGRLVRGPMEQERGRTLTYPEPASMQWLAYWGVDDDRDPPLATEEGRNAESGWSPDYSDACGLYWGTEDGEVCMKRFVWDPAGGRLAWHIENVAELPGWPIPEMAEPVEVSYRMPYEAVTAVFTGDWHEAAQMYHEWAAEQQWAQRGPMDEWPEAMPEPGSEELVRWTPPWFREIGFWAKFYHEPAKILPEWAAYRRWLRVPMASHWYRYNIASFNDDDPEHLPPDPYLLEGVRAARELGVEPMPYVLSTIWDTDTQSWIREDARRSALKSEAGEIRPWHIRDNVFAWMCPHTEQWRAKIRKICTKLIREHGMSGVYLDVLAAGAAKPCYDPDHGHPIGGGSYYGQGARALADDMRAEVRRLDPDACCFTEEIGEHLIDVMDGFLTLDLTRSHTPGGEQVWPILTAVYHPYTINFGSDAQIGMEPEEFAVIYGRQLVWGSQPLHSVLEPPMPEEGDVTSELFREYTRAFHVAGKPFLTGGRMLRLAVRPKNGPAGRCGLEMAADEHTVAYGLRSDRLKLWTGPAVLASAWERHGDTGIVMANITGEARTVELTVRGEVLGLDGEQMVRLWPGEPETLGEAAGEHELTLEPWACAVYVLTGDADAAIERLNPLEETPWELVAVQEGQLGPVEVDGGNLWACSDGPVLCRPEGDRQQLTPHIMGADGFPTPRTGRQAEVTGAQAEGHGLPRDLDERPFALLRRLPHEFSAPRGEVMVFSGDDNHVLAVVPGGTELKFARDGLLVATDGRSGEVAHPLSLQPPEPVVIPEGEAFLVGWARFEDDEVEEILRLGDPSIARRIRPWAERLVALMEAGEPGLHAQMAAASRELIEVAQSLSDTPGALSPVGPLTALHERLNALLVASLNAHATLTTEHRWLAPEVEKRLTLMVQGRPARRVQMHAIGSWQEGTMAIEALDRGEPVGDGIAYRPTIRLDDGAYVERMIPVLGSAIVENDGLQYAVSDVLRLEANRPFKVISPNETLSVVAGQPRRVELTIRNWSPLDLTVSVSGSGPRGWTVAPEKQRVEAPALSDTSTAVTVQPPADASAGTEQVRVVTNHGTREQTGFISLLEVNVREPLEPLRAEVARWEEPAREERSRIRNSGTFAIYAEEGEQIRATIENIRVTRYEDTLRWSVRSPMLEILDEGTIPVDESASVELAAPATGAYFLEVTPGQGSADVRVQNRAVAELATEMNTLQLFESEITRHFYVPEDSVGFHLGARDGGPAETALIEITAPGGRVAFEADGNYNGAEFPVEVREGEAGNLWMIHVRPRQDIEVWLGGDVMPYLSTAPERVLRAAAGN